jgi:predicted DNA-binding protein
MRRHVSKTFYVDPEVHDRVIALSRRIGVPAVQLIREAEELVLERYEHEEDAAKIHARRAEDRERLVRAREAARTAPAARLPLPPKRKTIDDYYAAGERPKTERIG